MSVGCMHNPELACPQCQAAFNRQDPDGRETQRRREFEELLDEVCTSRKKR